MLIFFNWTCIDHEVTLRLSKLELYVKIDLRLGLLGKASLFLYELLQDAMLAQEGKVLLPYDRIDTTAAGV